MFEARPSILKGEVYLQPTGCNMGIETRFMAQSHLDRGTRATMMLRLLTGLTMRFWPDEKISEDYRNNTWQAQVKIHRGITIVEVKAALLKEKSV